MARFVTPNLERLARRILEPQEDADREIDLFSHEFRNSYIDRKYPKITGVDYMNMMFREWGHQYLYTISDLEGKLKTAGFSALIETRPNECANKLFENAQGHGRLLGYELNDLNAFALEATK